MSDLDRMYKAFIGFSLSAGALVGHLDGSIVTAILVALTVFFGLASLSWFGNVTV